MYGISNPYISSGLQGAVAYAQAEKERIENEKKLAAQKKKRNLLIGAGVLIAILYLYKNK